MALYTDTNGFPEGGFPVLSDVQDNLILNTLYQVPQKYLNYRMDVVGNNRLLGNLVIGGTLTGVSSLTMSGALSGVTTLGASSTVTLSSDTAPLTLSGTNAVLSITGANASIGTILQPVNTAWFKNLNINNTPLVNGDPLITTANLQAVAVPYSNAHSDVNLGTKLISAGNIETNATSLSTRLGLNALDDENESTAKYNVAIGRNALTSVTTGDYTTAVGTNCGQSVVGGTANSLFGYQCGLNLTSSQNSLFGYQTGANISSGNTHTAIGYEALKAITTASGCIGVGFKAGTYETGGNKLFIDALDRTNEATGRTDSIIYGVMNSTASSQELYLNSKLFARHLTSATKTNCLYYDTSTKEISYGAAPTGGTGTPGGDDGDIQFNSSSNFAGTSEIQILESLGTTYDYYLKAGALLIGTLGSGGVLDYLTNHIGFRPDGNSNYRVKLDINANPSEFVNGIKIGSSTFHQIAWDGTDLKLGLFGTSPVVKTSVTDPSAVVTTETADATYSTNEVNMLNNLKTDVTNLQSKLTTLINTLQSYGLI